MTTFDLIIIGAGSGGLTAAQFAAQVGAKVALVERHRVGGDCTWTGCVPSKALLKAAKVASVARHAANFGVGVGEVRVDMARVKAYVAERIARVYEHEAPPMLESSGIEVKFGAARFVDGQTIEVDGERLSGKKFVLCTGATARELKADGIASVGYHTHETIFDNDRLPEHLIVVGAGPIGSEIGQAYGRLGARVTLIGPSFLPREEPEVAEVMCKALEADGVHFVKGRVRAVEGSSEDFVATLEDGQTLAGDMLMVSIGRVPNVAGLGLDEVGVAHTRRGIEVDDKLRTTHKNIFAAGDCTGGPQFTHLAGWQGYIAARNALLPGSSSGVPLTVPSTTFTDPEVASVGLTHAEAVKAHGEAARFEIRRMEKVDRAVCDDAEVGFIKLVTHSRDGRVLGATVVSPHAGEVITEFILAIDHGLKAADLAGSIHVYPTYAIGAQQVAATVATEQALEGTAVRLVRRLWGYK